MKKSIRLSVIGLWAFLSAALFTPFVGPVCAQMRYEPSIEGVSYSEIASWQGRYGGGFSGCYPILPPACVIPPEEQIPCTPVKAKRRVKAK